MDQRVDSATVEAGPASSVGPVQTGSQDRRPQAEAILERARELAPRLRDRIAETEKLRQLPESTLRDCYEAEIFALVLPVARGGAGGNLREFVELVRVLGTGDTSAAWVLSFFTAHNWFLARWPEAAQDDFFGERAPVLMAGVANPPGRAEPVDGGYKVSGRWPYCSGVPHADWVLVSATIEGDGTPSIFVLPRDEVVVHDTWYMSGMQGTGSHDVSLDGAFVPTHRSLSVTAWRSRDNAGAALYPEPIYSYDLRDLSIFLVPAVIVGGAEAVLELYRERLDRRRPALNKNISGDTVAGQMRYARAAASVRSARALLEHGVEQIMETNARDAGCMAFETRTLIKLDCLSSCQAAWQGVQTILRGSGSSIYKSSDLTNHFVRDLQTLMGHLTIDEDEMLSRAGEILLGRAASEPDPTAFFL